MRTLMLASVALVVFGCQSPPTADLTIGGAALQLDGGVLDTQKKDSLQERVTIAYPTMSAGMEGPVFAQLHDQLVSAGWKPMLKEETSANYLLENGYVGRAYTLDMVGIRAGITTDRTFPLTEPWLGMALTPEGAVPTNSNERSVRYAFLAVASTEAAKAHEPLRAKLGAAGWVETKHRAFDRPRGQQLVTDFALPDGRTARMTSDAGIGYAQVSVQIREK